MARKVTKERKFAVGDRVVYNAREAGVGWMNGMHGTVIYVDGTRCPYTVEFDEKLVGGVTDERAARGSFKPRYGQSWFCREENLEMEA